ncbi:MAG: hypothetical protein ABJB49_05610, partial [Nitrospirota bacterium]
MELASEPRLAAFARDPLPSAKDERVHGITRTKLLVGIALCALLGLGVFLRVVPSSGFEGMGYDEHAYAVFVRQIHRAGLWNYDAVVQVYVENQYKRPDAVVPATRIGFLVPAHL